MQFNIAGLQVILLTCLKLNGSNPEELSVVRFAGLYGFSMVPEVSSRKCPTCGGKNLITASLCSQCGRPLAQLTQASNLADSIMEMKQARISGRKPDEKNSSQERTPREGEGQGLDREFVRPESRERRNPDAPVDPPFRNEYHPLAERALEKVNRARRQNTDTVPSNAPEDQLPPAELEPLILNPLDVLTTRKGRRQTSIDKRKVERIEISLGQGVLPFDSTGTPSRSAVEDFPSTGLKAAPLAARVMAGTIDTLFVLGCFLLFLGIVFFLPDFALLTRSSFLGLAVVLSLMSAAYLFLFITAGTQTLGMEYEGLQVVSFDGRAPSLKEVGLRVFGSFTSLGCFMLGFLWAFFDADRLTWHDRISKTLVVQK